MMKLGIIFYQNRFAEVRSRAILMDDYNIVLGDWDYGFDPPANGPYQCYEFLEQPGITVVRVEPCEGVDPRWLNAQLVMELL